MIKFAFRDEELRKTSKCMIGFTDIVFVGHELNVGEIHPRKEKVKEVLNVEPPTSKRQVKSFLAMAGYYSRFIQRFADIAFPLTELTKGRAKFAWEEKHMNAFKEIKQQLEKGPILRIVDLTKHMYVMTDASDTGVGAALLQMHEKKLHPVRYLSRKLKPAERNYSTIEKEGLAIVWAIEKLMVFLYGREFTLLTDHRPLVFMQNEKMNNGRVMRWSLFLQDMSFKIESIKGVDNMLADCLSRLS